MLRTITPKITPEIIYKAKLMGLRTDEEYLKNLLHTGHDYTYTEDGVRITPDTRTLSVDNVMNRENHHMIRPDPKGSYYLKVVIKGKTILKPLHKDEQKARIMRDKYLKQLNYVPSRHIAR